MRRALRLHDDREREVVRVWRAGHLALSTIRLYLSWVRHFRAHCGLHGLNETAELNLDGALRFAREYVGPRTKGPVGTGGRACARNALHAWACALQAVGAIAPPWRPAPSPARLPPLLAAYCEFRSVHCGVAAGTLERDVETARDFVALLQQRGRSTGRALVADVDAFVGRLAERFSKRTVADRCSSLRSFLRFLRTTGRLRRDLAGSVMAPRIRIAERPPRALPWTDVKRILRSISQSEPPGKRDFAMLLLMATYGLGAAEVLGLQLEDLDFKSQIIRARRPKTGTRIELPLLCPVARALTDYLHVERPPSANTRRIFIRANMPYEPLSSGAVRHRIRLYARRAGIAAPRIGAHAFRHSHASRQVDAGANLKVVSDILGHRSPSSTSVYVRVALARLRTVALPVPR